MSYKHILNMISYMKVFVNNTVIFFKVLLIKPSNSYLWGRGKGEYEVVNR